MESKLKLHVKRVNKCMKVMNEKKTYEKDEILH